MLIKYAYAQKIFTKQNISILKYENVRLKCCKDRKAFIEYSNDVDDVYKNIVEYIPGKECKVFIVFDDLISHMVSSEKRNPIITELFIRDRKLNISLVFITQSYFKVPKDVRLNPTQYFIIKVPNKKEL